MTKRGPLFDGRAEAELRRGIEVARSRIAADGQRRVHDLFAGSIRVDHGRFLASITTTDRSRAYTTRSGRHSYTMPVTLDRSSETAVTTDLASYGPWLEGVGSRNDSTRFKGYHGFRRAGQELSMTAKVTAERALAPHVEEMNR